MILLWDPFLMKILLKKEVCTSREQCTGPTGKVGKKKKKGRCRCVNMERNPNGA